MIRASLDHAGEVADLLNDPAIRPTIGGAGFLGTDTIGGYTRPPGVGTINVE